MNNKLLDYIKTARSGGMTDGQIKEELLTVGWKLPEIEESLKDSNTREIESVKVEESSSGFKMIVFVVFAVLFAAFSFYVLDKMFNWGIMSGKEAAVQDQVRVQSAVNSSSTAAAGNDISGSAKLLSIPKDYKLITAQFSPDGKKSLCTAESGNQTFILTGNSTSTGYDAVSSCKFGGNGDHFACVALKNNKLLVVLDGQEGKLYDSLVKNPVFSPSGEEYAYFAKSGISLFLVFNGKEDQIPFRSIEELVFSSDEKHFAYSASVLASSTSSVTSTASAKEESVWKAVVLDGEQKTFYADVSLMTFSPDGKHFAYAAVKNGKKILVLDDKEIDIGGEIYAGPKFSNDGKSVGYGAVTDNEVWWKTEAVNY
jgi:hypothetical protein